MSSAYQPSGDAQAIINAIDLMSMKMTTSIDTLRREVSKQFEQHDRDLRGVVEEVRAQVTGVVESLKPVAEAFSMEKIHNG